MFRNLLTSHVRRSSKALFIKPYVRVLNNWAMRDEKSLTFEICRSFSTKQESFEMIKRMKDSSAIGVKKTQNYAVFDEYSKCFVTKNIAGESSLPPSVSIYIRDAYEISAGNRALAGLCVVNENTEQRWRLPPIIWIAIGLVFLHDIYHRYFSETNTIITEHTTQFGKTYHISNRIRIFVLKFSDQEFTEIHDKLKQRGIRVEQSFWNKRIWHFVYSVRRRTPEDANKAEIEKFNLVMDEIEELKNRRQFAFSY